VILAIGQAADLALVEGTGVKTSAPGRLVFDPVTMAASEKGVFACGEVVTGPGSAIEAVASGHRAARAALRYVETGETAPVGDEPLPKEVDKLPEQVVQRTRRLERLAMPTLGPEKRTGNFAQFELGYDERSALAEARRCLACTAGATVDDEKCAACLTCLRVCPFGVPVVDHTAVMCSEMCQACGLCATECPALAISIKRFAVGTIRDRIARLLAGKPQPVERVELVCSQNAVSREDLADRIETRAGAQVAVVPVTCAALLDEVAMMKPFEFGARAVAVRTCADCGYSGAVERLARRVGRTQAILEACGVGGANLTLEIPGKERGT
jgi:ferredoxin